MTNFRIFCSWVLRLIVFAFSDNLSAENSKLSAEFVLQLLQLLECMVGSNNLFAKEGVFKNPIMDKFQLGEDQSWSK